MGKKGRQRERASSEGRQSKRDHATAHMAKVRSGNRGPEGAADERTRLGARQESDVFQQWVLEELTVLWICWRKKRKRA